MFATFKSSRSNSDIASLAPVRTPRPRGKRAQVRRACDRCRRSRVKCDASKPCHNCRHAGRPCITDGHESKGNGGNGLAVATSELERLQHRVRELEAVQGPTPITPQSSSPQPSIAHIGNRPLSTQWRWKGMKEGGLWYGPLSDQFFVRRLSEYTQLDAWVQPLSPSNISVAGTSDGSDGASCDRLGRAQQDYILDIYWTTYHVYTPAIEEDAFRTLYASLWPTDGSPRRTHPLVDMVLALTIQYSYPLMIEDCKLSHLSREEAYRVGNPFFRRCLAALDIEFESPTLMAAQCRLLASVYNANQGNFNAAHFMVRMAEEVLAVIDVDDGIHGDAELFRRVQTCSRSQDIRLSLKLGRIRPFAHPKSKELIDYVTEKEATSDFSWLTFHRQLFLLSETVEDMARAFMAKCDELLKDGDGSRFYQDASVRESCATFMRQQLNRLREWLVQVPDAMKTARIAAEEPFSTAQSPLKLAEGDPMWLQRLRLDLECQYHDFCIILLRPFLCFSPTPTRSTFDSDNNCVSCVSHAIALTGMLAQVMHETDVLTGCCQALEWLQGSVYGLAGFATGYPICPRSPTARTALAMADRVFVSLRSVAPAASRMRTVAAELEAKAREIVQSFREGIDSATGAATAAATTSASVTSPSSASALSLSRGVPASSAESVNPIPPLLPVADLLLSSEAGACAPEVQHLADPALVSGIGAVWDTDMEMGLEWWPSQSTGGPDLWNTWMQEYETAASMG